MIGRSFLQRNLQQQLRYGAMVQTGSRGFAGGGPKRAAIDPDTTEFDLVVVGKWLARTRLFPPRIHANVSVFAQADPTERP